MSKHETLYFLRDFRAAIVAFPAMLLYVGFLPALKLLGLLEISWIWALSPFWIPFLAFWTLIGFVSFLALVGEIGFWILPDKNYINGKELEKK